MAQKYTYDEVKSIIEKEYNVERLYLISENYKGNMDDIIIMNNDGYLLKTKLRSIVNSKRRNANFNFFYNKNDFIVKNIKRWLRKNTDNYTLLSKEYNTIHSKLTFKCGNNHTFIQDFHHLKNHGNGCQHCSKKYKRTTEDYKQDVWNRFENKYTILGKFEKAHKLIKTKCNTCENIWEVTPSNLLKGYGCPNCAVKEQIKRQTKTNEQFLKEVFDLVGNEFTF